MLKQRSLVCIVVVLLLVSLGLFGCGSSGSEVIKIGVAAPMTGDNAVWGLHTWNAAQLAAEEINEKGGVLGKKIELVKGDDKGDSKEAASVAQKFAADSSILAVIGHVFSSCSYAAGPIYQSAQLPAIAVLSTNPGIPKIGDYIFRIVFHDGIAGAQTAQYAVEKLGAKRIAMMVDNVDYSIGVRDAFVAKAEELGAEIVGQEMYVGGQDQDFTVQLTKLREKNPDILFLDGFHTEGALIAKQARAMGWDVQLLAPDATATPDFIDLAGDAVEGTILTTYFHRDVPDPKAQELVQKYEERFKEKAFVTVPYAYDAVYVLADAIERAGSTDRTVIRDALAETKDFPGVTGLVSFDQDGDRSKGWNVVLKVENGEYKILELLKVID